MIRLTEVKRMKFRKTGIFLLCMVLVLFLSGVSSPAMEEEEDFLPRLIAANIRGTDTTVILEIKEGERVRTLGGYALWRISAEVVRSFKGEFLPGEEIRYHRTTETEFPPPEKGSRHIVSFVLEEGNLVIPDEGYHFPWSPDLEEKVDALLSPSS
jgi:hypothetical protein